MRTFLCLLLLLTPHAALAQTTAVPRDPGASAGKATGNRWYEHSRAMRATRPDQQGRWQLKGLPAGEYLAAALDYVENDAWQDPEYLESLRDNATKVRIVDGAYEAVVLKVVAPRIK